MIQTRKGLLILCLVVVFCQESFSAFAQSDPDWKFSLSATYEAGTYGTNTETGTLYVPATVKSYYDMGDLSVTVPYISQISYGRVTVIDGTVFKIGPKSGTTAMTANSGPGDIILKGSLYLLEERKKEPFDLSAIGKIKFPTADEKKGLGTGQFDETLGVEIVKTLFPKSSLFVDASYAFIGNPPGMTLQNRISFDVGLAEKITSSLTGSIIYEDSTPLLNGNPDSREVLVNVENRVSKETRVFAGGEVGLTNTSPDYGMTAGVSVKF